MRFRQLPAVKRRVETKATKFGDDWAGVFIRGDDCGRFENALNIALSFLAKHYQDQNTPNEVFGTIGTLVELQELLESSNELALDNAMETKS